MWWLLLPAALLVSMAVLAIGAVLSPKHPQHARPRHLAAVPDPPPDYGSMNLADERTVIWDPPAYLLAAPVDPEPWAWREQMTAELAPEALEPLACAVMHGPEGCPGYPHPVERLCGPEQPQERKRSPGNENRDRDTGSGAGDADVVSSAPAPDPYLPPAGLAEQFDDPPPLIEHYGPTGDWREAQAAWRDGVMAATFNWSREVRVRLAAI